MATDATGTPTSLGIPKYNTSADAPSGLGFNAAMDTIDALLVARNPVITSVFGRTGVVVAAAGDYSAAQVTNAADKSSAATQVFTGQITTPTLSVSGTAQAATVFATSAVEVGATDTTVTRGAPGQVVLGGTANKGNFVGGGGSNNTGGPSTLTPDAAQLFNRWNLINASGTYTIAAPVNPPGAGQSGLLVITIHNASGGTVTLSWNAVFSSVPVTPPNGSGVVTLWVWNTATSKWDFVSSSGSIVD